MMGRETQCFFLPFALTSTQLYVHVHSCVAIYTTYIHKKTEDTKCCDDMDLYSLWCEDVN